MNRRLPLRILLSAALVLSAGPVLGQSPWLSAGDGRLRADLTLLVDEGVLQLDTSSWPIPADDVAWSMRRVDAQDIHSDVLRAAFARVAARAAPRQDDDVDLREVQVRVGRRALLRDYDSLGREEGEITVRAGAAHGRWSANLAGTAVTSPADGQSLRLDGSDLSLRLGNWNLSANTLERWWGPGQLSSLILSTNARPMPQLALDRVVSTPSSVPILRWAGPWRFTTFLAVMEGERADVNRPLFMGMRLSFKPLQILEVGLSRTAQFCGEGRQCNFSAFRRVLFGRDNAGIRVAAKDEPGNQMAGMDLRLVSPVRSLPLAAYAQLIGEDSSSSGIPEKYLGLFGVEGWWLMESGALRGYLEYSNTSCTFTRPGVYPNCAYRQGIFFAGYRYRGEAIGHTTDADSETRAAGLRWRQPDGDEWRLALTSANLDRFGPPDPYHSVVFGSAKYHAATLGWNGTLFGQTLSVQVDVGRLEPQTGDPHTKLSGYLQWSRRL